MTDAFATVRSGYDLIGHRYRDWSAGSRVRLRFVRRLQRELRSESLVLDLGCGPGEPATRLLAEEHRVLGVDASLSQLRLARDAAPSATLVQADMTRFALRPGCVDAVASFYALGHVPSGQHAPLFHAIAGWLRPGGVLLTSAPLLVGDDVDEDWLGVPMYFGGVGQQATRAALEQAGLLIEEWELVPEDEGEGKTVRFLWLLARKPVEAPVALGH